MAGGERNYSGLVWGVVFGALILWLLGVTFEVGGVLIHLLLVVAMVGSAYNLMGSRPSVD